MPIRICATLLLLLLHASACARKSSSAQPRASNPLPRVAVAPSAPVPVTPDRINFDFDGDGKPDLVEMVSHCGEGCFDTVRFESSRTGRSYVFTSDEGWVGPTGEDLAKLPKPNLFPSPAIYAHRFAQAGPGE